MSESPKSLGRPEVEARRIEGLVALARSAAAFVTGPAGPIANLSLEALQFFLSPHIEKRRNKWLDDLNDRLAELERRADDSRLAELEDNEEFATILIQTTAAAVRTHYDEKRQLLANVVLNAGVSNSVDFDMQLAFVRFVDELSLIHLAILRFVAENESLMKDIEQLGSYKVFRRRFIERNPDMNVTPDEFELVIADLIARALLRVSPHVRPYGMVYRPHQQTFSAPQNTGLVYEGQSLVEITGVGGAFLRFIQKDMPGDALWPRHRPAAH